jgi:hypothetical protein
MIAQSETGFEFEPTLPGGGWDDEPTAVDLVPAGALAPTRTLPPVDPKFLEDVATETVVFLASEIRRGL